MLIFFEWKAKAALTVDGLSKLCTVVCAQEVTLSVSADLLTLLWNNNEMLILYSTIQVL